MEAVKVNQTDRTFQVHGIIPASKKSNYRKVFQRAYGTKYNGNVSRGRKMITSGKTKLI